MFAGWNIPSTILDNHFHHEWYIVGQCCQDVVFVDHFDIGISGYKIDEVDGYDFWLWPDHATVPSGTSAEQMRQTYGMLMQQMLTKELYKAHTGARS